MTGELLTLTYLMCVDFGCFNRRITQYFARRRQQGVVCGAGGRCTLVLAAHICISLGRMYNVHSLLSKWGFIKNPVLSITSSGEIGF